MMYLNPVLQYLFHQDLVTQSKSQTTDLKCKSDLPQFTYNKTSRPHLDPYVSAHPLTTIFFYSTNAHLGTFFGSTEPSGHGLILLLQDSMRRLTSCCIDRTDQGRRVALQITYFIWVKVYKTPYLFAWGNYKAAGWHHVKLSRTYFERKHLLLLGNNLLLCLTTDGRWIAG